MSAARAALLLAIVLASHSAYAQQAPEPVVLQVPDCLGAASAEVTKLVALELAPRGQVVAEAGALIGRVTCAEPRVVIEVIDAARATPLRVDVDLAAAAPKARERLLALALAELFGTRQLERTPAPGRPSPEPSPEPEPAAQDDAPESAAALQLWLAPSMALAAEPTTALFGGALGAGYMLDPVLVALELDARFGADTTARSEVSIEAYSASLGVAPLLVRAPVQLSAGVALRAGYARLSARALRADLGSDSLDGLFFGPAAIAALHVPLAAPTALRLALEAGYHARPIVGLDEHEGERFALRGPWFAVSLGLLLAVI